MFHVFTSMLVRLREMFERPPSAVVTSRFCGARSVGYGFWKVAPVWVLTRIQVSDLIGWLTVGGCDSPTRSSLYIDPTHPSTLAGCWFCCFDIGDFVSYAFGSRTRICVFLQFIWKRIFSIYKNKLRLSFKKR